jgi:hypothetical protein
MHFVEGRRILKQRTWCLFFDMTKIRSIVFVPTSAGKTFESTRKKQTRLEQMTLSLAMMKSQV